MREHSAIQKLFDEAERASPSLVELAAQANSAVVMPSAEAYGYWSGAFDFFNERLFQGKLAHSLITLTRRSGVLGYFCPRAFEASDGRVAHEISMNPSWFAARGDLGSLSTLVH